MVAARHDPSDGAQPPLERRLLTRSLRTLLAVGAVVVLLVIGRRNASDLGRVHLHLRPRWLLPGAPLSLIGGLCLALGWRQELDAFGHRLPTRVAVRLWWRAQLARYVPTGLASLASRAALGRQVGVPPAVGAASLVLELAALVGWGVLGAATGIPSSLLDARLRVVLGLGAAAGLAALPVVYPRLAALGRRVPAVATLSSTPARRPGLYAASGLYGVSIVIKSAAFVVFTAALVRVHPRDAWLLAGAVQGASVIGIIGVTPAGIGIREGALVGLLAHRLGTTDAAAVAVAWRAWEFAFELAWLGLGTLWRPSGPGLPAGPGLSAGPGASGPTVFTAAPGLPAAPGGRPPAPAAE